MISSLPLVIGEQDMIPVVGCFLLYLLVMFGINMIYHEFSGTILFLPVHVGSFVYIGCAGFDNRKYRKLKSGLIKS